MNDFVAAGEPSLKSGFTPFLKMIAPFIVLIRAVNQDTRAITTRSEQLLAGTK
jgi:hypothetical protein